MTKAFSTQKIINLLSTWGPRSIRHAAVNRTSACAVIWPELLCKVLEPRLWRSHIATRTELRLYSGYVLPIMLRGQCTKQVCSELMHWTCVAYPQY